MKTFKNQAICGTLLLAISCMFACGRHQEKAQQKASAAQQPEVSLTLGAYSVPREAYGQAILPAFVELQKAKGKHVKIAESYLASGAQARAIAAGFEADIAALSLEPDIEQLVKAGLTSSEWKAKAGIITRSVVVLGVRKGNPKKILDWKDLARSDVSVLTPNPRTSGGAMWNVLGLVGALERGKVPGVEAKPEAVSAFLSKVLAQVKIMDRSGRDSMLSFERGVGDVVITYENEILIAQREGKDYDYVVPSSTVVIENPVALVDKFVEKHKVQAEASEFVAFLFSSKAQEAFAAYGFRPVDTSVLEKTKDKFAPLQDSFFVSDLGGWAEVTKRIFGESGLFESALQASRKKP